ncbi:BZ3500_MvSof-1268-A1-R1_Chr5-3g08342 [Microbotryum saponariae]|uniref:BZ3500_MvSof-1268-A1-R1_Chr5-3g08342 protein n=1 Tax=Microbotryum saponariae TaxID=289078 RepID=A0A2X0LS42_9BASI|nr:BZ3500_MvSof-1268-A1-R1_Chr5-3g08342 [Microbotryum saponariae]SDA08450.1 BZ3501_MvSof-1269-A2-R1_Chr5-3g08070 [Microbotryum saponariae]
MHPVHRIKPRRVIPTRSLATRAKATPRALDGIDPLLSPHFRNLSPVIKLTIAFMGRIVQSPEFDVDTYTHKVFGKTTKNTATESPAFLGMTTAMQDTTIVDRAIAALENGVTRDAQCGCGQIAGVDEFETMKPGEIQKWIYGTRAKRYLGDNTFSAKDFEVLLRSAIMDPVRRFSNDSNLSLAPSSPKYLRGYSLVRRRSADEPQASSPSTPTPQKLTTVVAGEGSNKAALDGFEAITRGGVDMRSVKFLVEGVENGSVKNGLLNIITFLCKENARFALLIANPYFLLAEFAKIDGRMHLLLDRVYSALDDGSDSTSKVPHRPCLALLISLFMDHHPSFKIPGPGEEVKRKIREKTSLLPKYDFSGMKPIVLKLQLDCRRLFVFSSLLLLVFRGLDRSPSVPPEQKTPDIFRLIRI